MKAEQQDELTVAWRRAIELDDERDRRGEKREATRPCQICGRPANYRPPDPQRRQKHHLVANDVHDLCERCERQRRTANETRRVA